MKLIYIINARIPNQKAHGYQICKMCEEFARDNIRVELWISTRYDQIEEDPFAFYGLARNFKIKKIKSFDFLKFYKYLGKYGFWLQSIFFLAKLLLVKADKEAVVYSRNPEIVWLFGMRRRQVIFEAHRWSKKNAWLYKLLIKRVAAIITVTNKLSEILASSGVDKKKILVAPDGVDLKKFDIPLTKEQARGKVNLPMEKLILGYSGSFKTMGEDKGIVNVFKAIKILSPSYPNIFFTAVGGSKDDIQVHQKIADDMGISNKIALMEKVSMDRLAIYQKACDALLMPFPFTKHYAHYMSPLKMFEYMASKRPVIASDLPSIREILSDNNAILVRAGDYKDLADGIKKIIINKELGDCLAEQAFQDVQEYSWSERANRILNFIIKQNY